MRPVAADYHWRGCLQLHFAINYLLLHSVSQLADDAVADLMSCLIVQMRRFMIMETTLPASYLGRKDDRL